MTTTETTSTALVDIITKLEDAKFDIDDVGVLHQVAKRIEELEAENAVLKAKAKFELKLVDGKLVIDLNSELEITVDGMMVRGYDGVPSKYDVCDLGPAPVIGEVELDEEQLAKIDAEYQNGGKCGWCDEIHDKLRSPHMFDRGAKGEKMCRHCWEHDREMYKGAYGTDIGPFDKTEESSDAVSVSGM